MCLISQLLPQRVERLIEELLPGVEVDEHEGLAVAAKAVLQEVGEARVPVGDMGVLLAQGHDDVAEVGQGLVDVLGLGQSHTGTARLLVEKKC